MQSSKVLVVLFLCGRLGFAVASVWLWRRLYARRRSFAIQKRLPDWLLACDALFIANLYVVHTALGLAILYPWWRNSQWREIVRVILFATLHRSVFFVESTRLWSIYYKLKLSSAASRMQWTQLISAESKDTGESNWFIANMDTFGNGKWCLGKALLNLYLPLEIVTLLLYSLAWATRGSLLSVQTAFWLNRVPSLVAILAPLVIYFHLPAEKDLFHLGCVPTLSYFLLLVLILFPPTQGRSEEGGGDSVGWPAALLGGLRVHCKVATVHHQCRNDQVSRAGHCHALTHVRQPLLGC